MCPGYLLSLFFEAVCVFQKAPFMLAWSCLITCSSSVGKGMKAFHISNQAGIPEMTRIRKSSCLLGSQAILMSW